jgi:hypothetical protein
MVHTALTPLIALLGGLKAATQIAIGFGIALAEIKIAQWLIALGQSTVKLLQNVTALTTETAALKGNTAAQIANAAARAAGGGGLFNGRAGGAQWTSLDPAGHMQRRRRVAPLRRVRHQRDHQPATDYPQFMFHALLPTSDSFTGHRNRVAFDGLLN